MNYNKSLERKLFIIFFSTYFINFSIDVGFSIKPIMILSLVIGIPFFIKNGIKKKSYDYELIFTFVFLFICIRGVFSKYNIISFKYILGIIYCIYLYVFIFNICKKVGVEKTLKIYENAAMFGLIVNWIIIILGIKGAVHFDKGFYRINGMLEDPNFMVLYFTPLYFLCLKNTITLKFNFKYLIKLLFVLLTIILTWSKGGVLGILIGSIIFIINVKKFNLKFYIKLILGIILVLFLSDLLDVNSIIEKISGNDLQYIVNKRFDRDTVGSGRIQIWMNAIKLFQKNCLFGIGVFNFRDYNQSIYNDHRYMHNTYLELLVENGLFLFLLFALGIIILLIKDYGELNKVFKVIIFSIIIQLFFLSGLLTEQVYIILAIYKIILLNNNEVGKEVEI